MDMVEEEKTRGVVSWYTNKCHGRVQYVSALRHSLGSSALMAGSKGP